MSRASDRRTVSAGRVATIRRLSRWLLAAVGGAVAVVLLARPAAMAGDMVSNVGPASQLQAGSLMDAYPLGHYVLDHHFAAVKAGVLSGVDVSGIPPTIALFLANMLWQLTAFLAHALITLFTFAFSLDLVGGSGATGGASALEPVSRAVRSIYQRTFGEPWLIVAVLLAGLWAIYNALVRRRYVETAGSLAMSVLFVVIALAFVTQPERTIGSASKWSNAMSGAFLSLTSSGSVSDPGRAKQSAADQLFTLLVYDPWTVLQFGGREHCVKTPTGDKPQSVPVRPLSKNPGRDGELSRQLQRGESVTADGKVCVSNRNKYAPRFLQFPSGSGKRDKHYEALKDGDRSKLDDDDPAKKTDDYRLGPADKPAAEAMGKGGQYERLLMAIVIFVGELGVFLLLGALSVAVILAQVLVLLLMAFAPVALVVGVFPGRGHEFFLGWLSRLAGFLLRKAIYSLILAVLLAVGAAIDEATSSLGWLMAFGLQGAFYWSVFLGRRQLAGQLTLATTGPRSGTDNQAVRLATLYATARMAKRLLPGRSPAGPAPGPRSAGPAPTARQPDPRAPLPEEQSSTADEHVEQRSRADEVTDPRPRTETASETPSRPSTAEAPTRPAHTGELVPSAPGGAEATNAEPAAPAAGGRQRDAGASANAPRAPGRTDRVTSPVPSPDPRASRTSPASEVATRQQRVPGVGRGQNSDESPQPARPADPPPSIPPLPGSTSSPEGAVSPSVATPTEQVAAPHAGAEAASPLERELRTDSQRFQPHHAPTAPTARRRPADVTTPLPPVRRPEEGR